MPTIPGLPTRPCFYDIDLDPETEQVNGLFWSRVLHFTVVRKVVRTCPDTSCFRCCTYCSCVPALCRHGTPASPWKNCDYMRMKSTLTLVFFLWLFTCIFVHGIRMLNYFMLWKTFFSVESACGTRWARSSADVSGGLWMMWFPQQALLFLLIF